MASEAKLKISELYRRAVFNQYNAILLGGAGLFAATTLSWIPLLIGAGAEALWLVLGADSAPFKRWVLREKTREAQEHARKQIEQALKSLDPWYLQRFTALERTSQEIQTLAKENPSLESSLIDDEMKKLGHLIYSFLRMALVHQRLARYLIEVRGADLEADVERCSRGLEVERSGQVRASLQQALELAQKRQAQHEQIEASCKSLGVQMETLEKALSYLKSHIINVSTQDELRDQLDGLVTAVDAVEELERETSTVLDDLDPESAAEPQRLVRVRGA